MVVLTGFVDSSSGAAVAEAGFGFTPDPNDYFVPAVPACYLVL
jgi:hypothetical protein